jgi:hypothetical protein
MSDTITAMICRLQVLACVLQSSLEQFGCFVLAIVSLKTWVENQALEVLFYAFNHTRMNVFRTPG